MLTPFFGFPGVSGIGDAFDPHTLARGVHMHETPTAVVIEIEAPRFRDDDIQLSVSPSGDVTVRGSRTSTPSYHSDTLFDRWFGGAAPASHFEHAFVLSPRHYDLSQVHKAVEHGVLTLTVPKRARPATPRPVTIYGGEHAAVEGARDAGNAGTVAAPLMSREDFQLATQARWPPASHTEDTPQALVYHVDLPQNCTPQNCEIVLRGRSLVLSFHHRFQSSTAHSHERRSATFSTTLAVPEGTQPEMINTDFSNGKLNITINKSAAAPGSAPKLAQQQQPVESAQPRAA